MSEKEISAEPLKEDKAPRTGNKKNSIDMLHGNLLKSIWLFAIPLIATSFMQQLFVTVDMAVIGKFASSEALAAVGCTSPLINLLINLFIGFSIGANAVIARTIGQNDRDACHKACHTSMFVAVVGGFSMLFVGFFVSRPMLELVNTPENIIDMSTLYFRLYFLGVPFMMVYNFGASILRSKGDTKRPMYILFFTGILHAILNIILVVPFEMSVAGVGIATLVSQMVNAVIILYILAHEDELVRVSLKKLAVYKRQFIDIIKIGLPAGLQGTVFSISNICVQSAINSFGSDASGGSAAALIYECFAFFAAVSFSSAATTFVSQNYGAGQFDRCKAALRYSLVSGAIACELVALIFVGFGEFWLGLITDSSEVIRYGMSRMTHILLFEALITTYEVTGAALRGLGHSLTPALITIFGTCVLRLVWVFTVCQYYHDFDILMSIYPISWVITGSLVSVAYFMKSRREFSKKVTLPKEEVAALA